MKETHKRKIKIILATAALLLLVIAGFYISAQFEKAGAGAGAQPPAAQETPAGVSAVNNDFANIFFADAMPMIYETINENRLEISI